MVYATDPATGACISNAVGSNGLWGLSPRFTAQPGVQYESPSPPPVTRPPTSTAASSRAPQHRQPARRPPGRRRQTAKSSVTLTRPRGDFDAQRDTLRFDGKTTLPGVPPAGADVSSAKINLSQGW